MARAVAIGGRAQGAFALVRAVTVTLVNMTDVLKASYPAHMIALQPSRPGKGNGWLHYRPGMTDAERSWAYFNLWRFGDYSWPIRMSRRAYSRLGRRR